MQGTYDHYPLVKKALDEQSGIFTHSADGLPQELHCATIRAVNLIDTHVQNYAKESMMAVAVLMNCPPYISLKSARFKGDYNEHVQNMLDIHAKGDGITAANEDLIQVYSAMFIAHGENLLAQIKTLSATEIGWMKDIREGLEEYLEDRALIEHKIAPGLLAMENDLIKSSFTAIDAQVKAATPQKPFIRKKGAGPSP